MRICAVREITRGRYSLYSRARLLRDRTLLHVPSRQFTNLIRLFTARAYGRGGGVGRGLGEAVLLGEGVGRGVAVGVGVAVAVAVAVAVGVVVAVAVAVAVAVGVGVAVPPAGAWIPTVMGDPVLKKPTVALAVCGG